MITEITLGFTFLLTIAIAGALLASAFDLKTTEIPNWIPFSLIIFALIFRLIYSIFNSTSLLEINSWQFFLQGLLWAAIFIAIGYLFYYSRLFAAGDAKIMMSLGPVITFGAEITTNLYLSIIFLGLFLFSGSIYGIIFSLWIGIKNYKRLGDGAKKEIKNKKYLSLSILIISTVIIILGFFSDNTLFIYLGISVLALLVLTIYAKIVDSYCMIRKVPVEKLMEGDWLEESVKIGEYRKIQPYWQGLDEREIKEIRDYYKNSNKKVKIKQGIPFSPVFLISLLLLAYLWITGMFWGIIYILI